MAFDFDRFRADMVGRIDMQHPQRKNGTYGKDADREALELLCGAAMALDQIDPDAARRMTGWAFLCSVRGLSGLLELIDNANQKEAA